jgi:Flp pilus assembly pilin Flp
VKRKIEDAALWIWVLLWHGEAGQDLVEYALLIVLVSLAAVAGMNALATAISAAFQKAGAQLTNPANP